jgi:hypothetical protein
MVAFRDFEQARWNEEGILSVYTQERPAEAGRSSKLRVMDFAVGAAKPDVR